MEVSRNRGVSHRDIALAMNINQSTVSRALDPARCHLVSRETREKVGEMVARLGFRPNIHARRVRTSCSEAITLVLDDITTPTVSYPDFNAHASRLFMMAVKGVIDGATENEFDVKLLPLHSQQPLEQDFMLRRMGFPYSDGVIFLGFHHLAGIYDLIRKLDVPCLALHGGHSTLPMPKVETDLAPGYMAAVRALAELGHRDIAFAAPVAPEEGNTRRERFELYRRAMRELGLEAHIRMVITPTALDLRRAAEHFAASREFSALLCFNDAMADLWRREIEYLGLSAGRDLSLVGCDGNPAYRDMATVRIPFYEMGYAAGKHLAQTIKNHNIETLSDCMLESVFQPGKSMGENV